MRNVFFFALLIGGPLFYLREHAYSFRLHQDIARLQEQRQRMKEVCDSLAAVVGVLNSNHRIETRAVALGMKPKIERSALMVAEALAAGEKKTGKPATAGRKPAGGKPGVAGLKKSPAIKAETRAGGKPAANGQKAIAGRF
jgi:ribosomal protein L15E